MNFKTWEEVTWHGNINELSVTDMIIKSVEHMDLRQTMKGFKVQNIEKHIYHPNNRIAGVEYEENDDDPNNPDTTETESGDYSTGYYEDTYLEEEEKYIHIKQSEIYELLVNETPL